MVASAAYTTKCMRDPLSSCWMVCRSAGRLNCPVVGRTINCVAVTRNIIISFRIYFCIIIPAPADKSRHQRTTATGTGTGQDTIQLSAGASTSSTRLLHTVWWAVGVDLANHLLQDGREQGREWCVRNRCTGKFLLLVAKRIYLRSSIPGDTTR